MIHEIYEEQYYGIKLGEDTKSRIYSALENDSLFSESPLIGFSLFLNPSRNEVILTKGDFSYLLGLELTNDQCNEIRTYILSEKARVEGDLMDKSDIETLKLFEFLVASIRCIKYLIYHVSNVWSRLPLDYPRFEGDIDESMLQDVSTELRRPELADMYKGLSIPTIVKSIRSGCYFLFKSRQTL